MAFTGAATITAIGGLTVRITGVSVGGGATGTIGLLGDTGADLQLPSTFPTTPDDDAGDLTMSDLVQVSYVQSADAGANESRHIHVRKTESPFRISVINDQGGQATGTLEIYVHYYHSMTR